MGCPAMVSFTATKDKAVSLLRRFGQDRSGNVIMLFGLALIPILGLAGAAIDYARATTARAELNAAVDSAALMAARDAAKLTDAQLTERINGWIKGSLSADEAAKFTSATIGIDRTARTVTIAAKVPVGKTMFDVINGSDTTVTSNSQSSWGTSKIEIALALDNTGSMASSGKMDALKTASKNLITIMKDATTETGQIKIAIVPFATQVRFDPATYKNSTWLRYDLTRCLEYYKDAWGRDTTTCKRTETITKAAWRGCVADRDKNNDTTDSAPNTGVNSTLYPADFCRYGELATIRPLTDNWTNLNSTIDAMVATGNTNVTIGAAWGQAAVSQQLPLSEAQAATTPRLQKFMILLTDGDNTENRFKDNVSTMDARTALACTSAKNAGIRVYTIRVIDGNGTLLRNCASDPSMYYDVKNASELSPVFNQIAREISAVRLTQ
jgi:Flp pilus assembly protein TadG